MQIKEPYVKVYRHPWYNGYVHICENSDLQDIFGRASKLCISIGDNNFTHLRIIPNDLIIHYEKQCMIPTKTIYVKILQLMITENFVISSIRYTILEKSMNKWRKEIENYDKLLMAMNRTNCYKEELISKTWVPSRHINWCLSIDEQTELKEDLLF